MISLNLCWSSVLPLLRSARDRRRWGWWAVAGDPVFVLPRETAPGISMAEHTRVRARSSDYKHTVKLQIFVRYLFSYFRLETGSYVLIFVLSRVCEENDVEIQWLQSKKKFSYDIKFRTFSKVRNVRK